MRPNRYIRILATVLMLLFYGAGEVWAQQQIFDASKITINVMPSGTEGTSSVTATEGSVSATVSDREVTLTVTPASGYYIKASDIVVEPLVGTERANARRRIPGTADQITGTLTIHNDETNKDDVVNSVSYSQAGKYVFTLPTQYDGAYVTATFTSTTAGGTVTITSSSSIVDDANIMSNHYVIVDDIPASWLEKLYYSDISNETVRTTPFTGTFEGVAKADGTFPKITGLTHALFNIIGDSNLAGGVVKNIVVVPSNSGITGSNHVGAIANDMAGTAVIYNCGVMEGSVFATNTATDSPKDKYCCGGLVGFLKDSARVINCYSFADITGGNRVGGIVGYNNATTTAASINTMVMNCMFYGDITNGNKVSPVYGGNNINNLNPGGLNTFNYYAFDELKTKAIDFYNCALAVENKYLTRIEFYRQLLNSNKKLAAYYASTSSTVDPDEMAKWVLETADRSITDPKPYPVLKARGKYPSIINYDAENAPTISLEANGRPSETDRNKGGKLGTLSVTISGVGSNAPSGAAIVKGHLSLIRTDKDPARFNFNYDKVQLPYYNEVGTKNYTGNRVVTGWKITAITAIDGDPYTSSNYPTTGIKDFPDHNYADRKSSKKDLYSVSGRVFSQGAYFDVPYGVTSITIEPYWGYAAYVADEYLDVVCKMQKTRRTDSSKDRNDYVSQNVEQLGQTFPTGKITINGSEQTVYTSIANALGTLNGATVYDNAVVLVGNLHKIGVPSDEDKPFTMMSVDLDKDNEPDYSLIFCDNNRCSVSPIRFDFLNVPGMAQAQKPNGTSILLNAAIFRTKGWFEITNTAMMYFTQFEYENLTNNTKSDAPLILLGGYIDQFVSTQSSSVSGKTIYIHVGSNVLINSFGLGTHSDGSTSTPHVPVSVTGGDYKEFYLTGTYNQNASIRDDNAECYISGGRFGELAGAAQEQIGKSGGTNNGNVRWQIYDADITNFYGGGVNDAKPVQGNITTDIFNSHVTTFCGGPKFGNMAANKTVTTTAEGCVFGNYFGAGYGGNSYSRKKYFDSTSFNWNTLQGYYTSDRGKYFDGSTTNSKNGGTGDDQYGKKGPGVATDFDYEYFVWTSGDTGVRFFVKFVSFSLAQCNNVNSELTNCIINQNFYGGGSMGKVTGKATSVLDGCTVEGNVFGGGYSGVEELPKIPVRSAGFTTNPNFNSNSGMFEPGVFSGTTDYEWKETTFPENGGAGTEDDKYVKTNVDFNTLGQVGETELTITGNTQVVGNVFGGGDKSTIMGDTKVDIQNSASEGLGYVYGGGNTADVNGNTKVTMTDGTVVNDIYGGGKGQTTIVGGNVVVNIGAKADGTGELSGSGTIGDVYGGSAMGAVNAKKENSSTVYSGTDAAPKTTQVNIYGCTSISNVYGGGLGDLAALGGDHADIAAQNFGNTIVNMEGGTVSTAVYGGSNANGVLKKDATVTITGGTVGTAPEGSNPITNVVFGGGYGDPTLVNGNVTVNIGREKTGTETEHVGTATINGHVYGGGALGSVNTSKPESALEFDNTKKVDVNLYKGTIHGNVYGGGLGRKAKAAVAAVGTEGEQGYVPAQDAVTPVESYVGGNVTVKLDGAAFHLAITTVKDDENNDVTAYTSGQIFGCNNLNGTPKGHVLVHVKRTVAETGHESDPYHLGAVYGGGNEADYNPTDTKQSTEVVIEGCDVTRIKDVYGGGNAAAAPATDVWILACKQIENVFGGGNGELGPSHAANVDGQTFVNLVGGTITNVYGGSNSNGDIRGGTNIQMPQKSAYTGTAVLNSSETCTLRTTNIYGGGKNADMSSGTSIVLGCMPDEWIGDIYAGAQAADLTGNVNLTITSGKFGRVFGGNKDSGKLEGSITVNIEETGECDVPVVIGELYAGGNLADYSIYGYDNDGKVKTSGENPYADPQLNVRAFTSIGAIYGGGYSAKLVGNPSIDINVVKGSLADNETVHTTTVDGVKYFPEGAYTNGSLSLPYPKHKKGEIGAIGDVYGGGYQGDVIGNTQINIGTETTIELSSVNDDQATTDVDEKHPTVLGANITGNVYGGGYGADIDGNTKISVGTVDLTTKIGGDVFGGGFGETTTVTGDVEVNLGKKIEATESTPESYVGFATISGDVYGGSAKGKVNATKSGTAPNITYAVSSGTPTTKVNFYGGTIATGHSLYGGGYGEDNAAADVYGAVTVNVYGGTIPNVFGGNNLSGVTRDAVNVNIAGGTISENVYGGGNNADALVDVTVTVTGGSMVDVFGGGKGQNTVVGGDVTVNIGAKDGNTLSGSGAVTGDVYGGSALGAVNATKTTVESVTTLSHTSDKETYVYIYSGTVTGNVFGGGLGIDDADDSKDVVAQNFGNTTVTMEAGTVSTAVYGGANANGVLLGNATVTISGGTINSAPGSGDPIADVVFGGGYGQPTRVDGDVKVNIGTNTSGTLAGNATIHGNVYGGSAEGKVNGTTAESNTHTTQVNLNQGTVNGAVFGGGLGTASIEANVYGYVTVTTNGGSAQDVFGCNNVNGAPQQTVVVTIDGGIIGNVYGGGKDAPYPSTPTVAVSNGTVSNNVYGGGLGSTAITGGTNVTISGGLVNNDVFGGGSLADVTGNVSVSVTGGTIVNDVYGGGALANTNTGNWDPDANSGAGGWKVESSTSETYYEEVKHVKYVQDLAEGETEDKATSVTGYYEDSSGNTLTSDTRAQKPKKYYKKIELNEDIYDIAVASGTGTQCKTTVELTGGLVGNVYGGGLGHIDETDSSKDIAAMVYGDVTVTVNGAAFSNELQTTNYTEAEAIAHNAGLQGALVSDEQLTADQATAYNTALKLESGDEGYKSATDELTEEEAAAYNATLPDAVSTTDLKKVPKTGRVFGCNNLKGTPKGKVLVQVYQTVREDGGNHEDDDFEILAVYGGGNVADYEPETYDIVTEFGQRATVKIDGCNEVSIEKVYGGGSAAKVPFTNVIIEGAYQIGYVFGGGNGGDRLYYNDSWHENNGADVPGFANVLLRGGTIGMYFGGSDTKGTVGGAETKEEEGDCDLHIVNFYGAGNGDEATTEGDIFVHVSGCNAQSAIQKVFGGSYKANVKGSITLNITSGIFTSVYGGNDRRGTIGGNITVNIEETEDCDNPIIIQNLYGGCYETPYPGKGAKYKDGDILKDFDRGKITVNVKSATRIDKVYGGSYKAAVNGDTEVNINMTKGSRANQPVNLPRGYRGNPIPNLHNVDTDTYDAVNVEVGVTPVYGLYTSNTTSDENQPINDEDAVAEDGVTYYERRQQGTINDAIGTIGNVYGGGYQGVVNGDAVVNIGSETSVTQKVPYKDENNETKYNNVSSNVLGANITGDVFGGGNKADVTGNTYVNIYTKQTPVISGGVITDYTYTPVDFSGITGFEGVSIEESVYGGGSEADVLSNTRVTMAGGYVVDGVYGGGLRGSVGSASDEEGAITYHNHPGCIGKIEKYKTDTGKCTVVISGGQIGPVEAALTNGGMKNTGHHLMDVGASAEHNPVDVGFVFGAGRGEVENPETDPDADFRTYVKETDVTISGGIVMASVYGGGENGRVRGNTHVKIQGGQIGCGEGKVADGKPVAYTEEQWTNAKSSDFTECASWDYGKEVGGKTVYLPYDPLANIPYRDGSTVTNGSTEGSDGHTYYGYVFGGGSGYFPYEIKNSADEVIAHDWLPSAGLVEGNTKVEISGGHILTCVYGGNELTSVEGDCEVIMTGGTLGVPRSDEDILNKPVTCYLFGGGKGDQREHFKMYTNVRNTRVEVKGSARIFGSVFGGAEDGHVSGDAEVNILGSAIIGMNGTSYVDGNVFGGGRGFSGTELTAGTVRGNTFINVSETPTILGSIYGGGRLASVGVDFSSAQDPDKGQFIEDETTGEKKTYGHVTINISGGTIGNTFSAPVPEGAKYSGNVFGGSMGRLTLLDDTPNSLWNRMAQVKTSTINITGGTIKRNVYGGSEFGTTRDHTYVTIGGTRNKSTGAIEASGTPTINGHVFGGGYGSTKDDASYISNIDAGTTKYLFTPMQYAGIIGGETEVNIAGGTVQRNVYGGGELASVGIIDFSVQEDNNGSISFDNKKYSYKNVIKHADIHDAGKTSEKVYGFGLSWPYKFEYVPTVKDGNSYKVGGKTTVNITGGHIGSTTWDDRTGYVFGGSKGQVAFKKKVKNDQNVLVEVDITDIHEQRYIEGLCANVRETVVNVNYSSTPSDKTPSSIGDEDNCIMGAVYGGGEDGHVYENAAVNITGGLIGLSVYGGGKGEGTYSGKLYALSTDAQGNLVAANTKSDVPEMPSWTAGKIYGNTSITMSDGHVMGNVYGGGNLGSVGKGNYAGGTDDYYPDGYGEKITTNLWTSESTEDNAWHFLHSGNSTVTITGGTVGTENGTYGHVGGESSLVSPTGMVFGGSRGRAAEDIGALSPRYDFAPDFFLGYTNETHVTIGGDYRCIKDCEDKNGKTHTIGEAMSLSELKSLFDSSYFTNNTPNTTEWQTITGSGPIIYSQVFGGGRDGHVRGSTHVTINKGTIGQTYETSLNDYQRRHRGNVYGSGSGMGLWTRDAQSGHGQSSGSVTRNTTVDIYGGIIYGNVYGGGAMASVGPPKITKPDYAPREWSKCTVNIHGGRIGDTTVHDTYEYGGHVYGASRGGDLTTDELSVEGNLDNYATTLWNDVNIKGGTIAGSVYGGGEAGRVMKDNFVRLTGGIIAHEAYGGGKGTVDIAADVGGNTTVELNNNNNEQPADGTKKGCAVKRIFGCNDLNGTPKGHVTVHVYATQHPDKLTGDGNILSKYAKYDNVSNYTTTNYDGLVTLANAENVNVDISEFTAILSSGTSTEAEKTAALENMREAISLKKYDVEAVYGGGNLAPYVPNNIDNELTSVIIDGCELTCIKQVYGGGNAAFVPATSVRVNGSYEIDEVFGGGNGKNPYKLDKGKGAGEKWYQNPGANVGYDDFTEEGSGSGDTKNDPILQVDKSNADTPEHRREYYGHGSGTATTTIVGGRIHIAYGGSNERGNISEIALSQYEESGTCDLVIDNSYGAGKNAVTDAEAKVDMACVKNMKRIFGGSTNADVYNDINLTITNGTFEQVFGGNDTNGAVHGSITVTIKESGCQPIRIDELYAGGYLAPYSIYGYEKNASGNYVYDSNGKVKPLKSGENPKNHPRINVISATYIGDIYGGGYKADVVGDPRINVNMEDGYVAVTRKEKAAGDTKTYQYEYTDEEEGKTYIYVDATNPEAVNGETPSYNKNTLTQISGNKYKSPLSLGYINNVFGGGNQADIIGNTYVEIGTGEWINSKGERETTGKDDNKTYIFNEDKYEDGVGEWGYETTTTTGEDEQQTTTTTFTPVDTKPTPARKEAVIKGSVYGGGKMGHVGNFTKNAAGKPISCADGTGECYVTISHGEIGPDNMKMIHTPALTDEKPDDAGHVFGAGQGTVDLLWDDTRVPALTDEQKQEAIAALSESALAAKITAVDNLAYANKTEVLINGDAFVKGSVYGGSENGHVLGDTHVTIDGDCQIGNGDGVNRLYTTEEWAYDGSDNKHSLAECAHWPYQAPYASHDKFANATGDLDKYSNGTSTEGGRRVASDGHTFYGNVFGGGSGYYPYAIGKWVEKAGWVEGNTQVDITGGHILTNVYGGNEMTDVGHGLTGTGGKCTVKMTGGTLGVPRTLAQIAAHPVTCYLFGAGKGDQRIFFNKSTNVKDVEVEVSGTARIYGSVFGGGEDGHVQKDVKLDIKEGLTIGTGENAVRYPYIGTWGTSYVDGNIFGGGRGFAGDAYTAGNVAGSVSLNISDGTMLGSVYGGGRLGSVGYGLYESTETDGNNKYGMMQDDGYGDYYLDNEVYKRDVIEGFKRGHIDITISGGTIGNTNEFIIPNATNITAASISETDISKWKAETEDDSEWTTWKNYHNVPYTVFDTSNGRLSHTKGGNVFAGGMGRYYKLDGITPISTYNSETGALTSPIDWTKLGNVKSTNLTISGDAWIMGNVYGGGEFGAVTGTHTTGGKNYGTEILINGGTIGTQIKDGAPVKYTFGSVYGGGYGTVDEVPNATTNINVQNLGALIADSTYISMSGGHVWASVYGGGEVAAVGGNTNVNISGGEIGKDSVRADGYVLFGGATMGNVYGSGKGTTDNPLVGVVKGNTTINISAGAVEGEPYIYHNVYGGGALASVGAFHPNGSMPADPAYVPSGVPYGWTENDGIARINITGGTIGISGHDNGMVNGAGRGDVALPNEAMTLFGNTVNKDPYDRFGWVNQTYVNIGTKGAGTGPKVKGSVYGGGENGHNNSDATVNVYSGTIGILENETWGNQHHESRGNVYGAGCGTDTYWVDEDSDDVKDPGETHHNPWSGIVCGNTYVNIWGGQVVHNVYGGGSLGSVGGISNDPTDPGNQHNDPANGFAYSWPTILAFTENSGKATVNIYGGRIGTTGSDNGDVFGGPKGKAGDPYEMAHISTLLETEVNIHYKDGDDDFTPSDDKIEIVEKIDEEDGKPKYSLRLKDTEGGIAGSVYGGSEDGHVYGNTQVNIISGYIGHGVYGGGKGKGTYIPSGGGDEIPDLVAGKVYGNTNIAMSGGHVLRNIYGGGNLGSVGKGNYAGGSDDYYTDGYGEKITGNLWTTAFDSESPESESNPKDNAWYFMNSGKATVEITGGIVGFMPQSGTVVKPLESDATTFGTVIGGNNDELKQKVVKVCSKDDLPTGNVFGGCRGQASAEDDELTLRLGYVNETAVTIGNSSNSSSGPRIYGSVYGGGQDGHVRRGTNVTINKGEIGVAYTTDNRKLFGTLPANPTDEEINSTTDLDNLHWLHRGNVYGAGSGIGQYEDNTGKHESSSAGSVTHTTSITIGNGIDGVAGTQANPGNVIYRNIYGGGSFASVCPPSFNTTTAPNSDDTGGKGKMVCNTVSISGTVGAKSGYVERYGGEVYGGSRGKKDLNANLFALSVWTKVLIKNGANIMGNVFGGGDAGKVLKDTNVIVGAE